MALRRGWGRFCEGRGVFCFADCGYQRTAHSCPLRRQRAAEDKAADRVERVERRQREKQEARRLVLAQMLRREADLAKRAPHPRKQRGGAERTVDAPSPAIGAGCGRRGVRAVGGVGRGSGSSVSVKLSARAAGLARIRALTVEWKPVGPDMFGTRGSNTEGLISLSRCVCAVEVSVLARFPRQRMFVCVYWWRIRLAVLRCGACSWSGV